MLAIILAVGKSTRFAAEGYTKPKYLLETPTGETIMERQIKTLESAGHQVMFVGRHADKPQVANVMVRILMKDKSPFEFTHQWLDVDTAGPLATAWEIRSWFHRKQPVIFVYCDTIFDKATLDSFEHVIDGYGPEAAIIGFESNQDRYTRIPGTDWAAGGIFYFADGEKLIEKIRWAEKGEFNGLPDMVYSFDNNASVLDNSIVDVGIPQDYRNWMAENGKPVEPWR